MAKKRKFWRWGCGCLTLVVAIPVVTFFVKGSRDEAAFQDQLRLARQEGLPTTAEEFAATLPKVSPEENAAPFYRQLRGKLGNTSELSSFISQIIRGPSRIESIKRAKLELAKYSEPLAIVEEAIRLPKCSFDRNWELGFAVLLPEYADMKSVSRVLLFRATLAAEEGRVEEAIKDIQRLLKVGLHAKQEDLAIPQLVGESIELMAVGALTSLSHRFREAAYAQELKLILELREMPDPKKENRDFLFNVLILLDQVSTAEGRRMLGISKQDERGAGIDGFFGLVLDKGQSKVALVRSVRDGWKAIEAPLSERRERIDEAAVETGKALLAFPMAGRVAEALGVLSSAVSTRTELWKCSQLKYRAAYRALSQKKIPKSIKTDDLLSPFDGKPITYRYDGKQIVIEVSAPSDIEFGPSPLKIPPDTAVK